MSKARALKQTRTAIGERRLTVRALKQTRTAIGERRLTVRLGNGQAIYSRHSRSSFSLRQRILARCGLLDLSVFGD